MIGASLVPLLLATGAFLGPADGQNTAILSQRADAWGDALPPGTVARIGTVRLQHTDPITAIAFSPDGSLVAAGDWSQVRIWEVATGKELQVLDQLPASRFPQRAMF